MISSSQMLFWSKYEQKKSPWQKKRAIYTWKLDSLKLCGCLFNHRWLTRQIEQPTHSHPSLTHMLLEAVEILFVWITLFFWNCLISFVFYYFNPKSCRLCDHSVFNQSNYPCVVKAHVGPLTFELCICILDRWRPTDPPAPSGPSPPTNPRHSESPHPNPPQPTFTR